MDPSSGMPGIFWRISSTVRSAQANGSSDSPKMMMSQPGPGSGRAAMPTAMIEKRR